MPVIFQAECGPKCRSKRHTLEVNSVITKGSLLDFQAYSYLCHTWAHQTDMAGRSALHVAASCGKLDIIEWLLTEKHQDLSLKDKESGWTALHRALFYGQLASARLLVQYNSDLYCRDHEGLGPLDILMKDRPKHFTFDKNEPNEVYSWGDNSNLTLGHSSEQRRSVPEAVDTFRRQGVSVKQIVMCKYHTVFLAHGGQVYTCGHGQGGRLGHGDELTCVTPRLVESLQKEECIQVAAARDHTLFLTEKNNVYGCGLNDCYQLGLTIAGDKGSKKSLVPVKVTCKLLKGKKILGVCAGRFHSVVYTSDGIYTCGLNAGQIGQTKGERFQNQLRMVSFLHHKEISFTLVASSDAAIACFTSRGDIFLLHEYACRKIGSRWLDVEKLCVCGGHLDHNTDMDVLREKGGLEVRVVWLNTSGKVFMWRSSSCSLKRCHFALRREVRVSDIALNTSGILLITDLGEAFTGYPSGKRSANVLREASKETNKEMEFGKISLLDLMLKDEVEEISLRRVAVIHRATSLACDTKGHNFAVMQALPNAWLTDVPCVSESMIHSEYQQLMEEANLYDAIHDCVVKVADQQWPAHLFILASRSDYFRKQVPGLATELNPLSDKPIVDVPDIEPEVMEQLLKFIYTDTCDVLNVGSKVTFTQVGKKNSNSGISPGEENPDPILLEGKSLSAVQMAQQHKEEKQEKDEKKEGKGRHRAADPVRILQEVARRFGVKGLSKRLEAVKCVNGVIHSNGKTLQAPHLKYDRAKLRELYDVCIRADDATTIQCHKSVLAARLEYFHSMLGSGWIETSDTKSLSLPLSGDILEILLDFVYQDDSLAVAESQDVELLCNVLVVADQFLVQRLKEMCEVALTSLMNLRNVGELLEIATAYNAVQLCQACQQFITLNLPALLESRSLDMVGDETMQELTEYYKKMVSRMSCRIITPWSEGPDADFLAALSSEFDAEVIAKTRSSFSKKVKAKRRPSRTKSMSEEPSCDGSKLNPSVGIIDRQISCCSDVSLKSEEDTELEPDSLELPSTAQQSPLDHRGSNSHHWLSHSAPLHCDTKTRDPALHSFTSQSPGAVVPPLSLQNPVSTSSGVSVSLRYIMLEQQDSVKSVKPKGNNRFSWKEVKKQQNKAAQIQKVASQDASHVPVTQTSTSTVTPPSCPWGSVNTVIPSFRDLMLQDKNAVSSLKPAQVVDMSISLTSKPSQLNTSQMCKTSVVSVTKNSSLPGTSLRWGLPTHTPPPHPAANATPPGPSLASSPPDNPWQRLTLTSPSGANSSKSFSAIVEEEMNQKLTLEKASQKPLHLIQIEEEAVSQLLHYYHADEQFDEYITIERVSDPVAAPLWNRKHSSSSSRAV